MGAQFLSSRVGGGPQVSALEDSLFLAWNYGDREVLFSIWTPVGAEAWGFRDDILGALGLDPESPDGRAALPGGIRNTANGVWALVSLRREHDAEVEDELRLSASMAIGGRERPRSPVVTYAPGVRNRLYDGGIVWMDLDGQPIAGTILPEDARGFVDDRHVFTLAESDDGVLVVRIWEIEGICPASGGG